MSVVGANPPKQYVVLLPDAQQRSRRSLAEDALQSLPQDAVEKNLSTETRKVVTLRPDQLETLQRQNPGLKIFENEIIRAPTPEELNARPVFDTTDLPGDVIRPQLKEALGVHGADKLHADGLRGKSSAFAPIVVTVDTGLAAHKDLETETRGLKFWDVLDGREEGFNDSGDTHGTHVSGIMLADGEVTGMAPDAEFIGIKVLGDDGRGSVASVISGIEKAAEYYDEFAKEAGRPMVVNLSLGGPAGAAATDAVHQTLNEVLADRPGLVFTFAAGNTTPFDPRNGPNKISSPGNFIHDRAMTVAASDTRGTQRLDDDTIAQFSLRGGDDSARNQNALRDNGIAADGVDVLSTVGEDGHAMFSGTSMASPMVGGAAALLFDYAGKLFEEGRLSVKPNEINPLALLRETALDHANISNDAEGKGSMRVDLAAALLLERYGKPAEAN